jgi:hypothetical protein
MMSAYYEELRLVQLIGLSISMYLYLITLFKNKKIGRSRALFSEKSIWIENLVNTYLEAHVSLLA